MTQAHPPEDNRTLLTNDFEPLVQRQRAKKPKRLERRKSGTFTDISEVALTYRDRVILKVIADYRAVTAQQVATLVQHRMPMQTLDNGGKVATSMQKIVRRLRALYDSKYLARPTQQDYLLHRSIIRSPIHTLDKRGGKYLIAQGYEKRIVNVSMFPLRSHAFMLHELGIAEFHRVVELGFAPHGIRIAFWHSAHKDWIAHATNDHGEKLVTNPDSFFCLERTATKELWYFFLEYDRGHKELGRVRNTYEAYAMLYELGLNTGKPYHMSKKGYRVITVTESKKPVSGNVRKNRTQSMKEQAVRAVPSKLTGMFWFINEGVYLDEISTITADVFETARDATKEQLIL